MKKTKRLLSMLTALAITAASFAAMVIPASAAVTAYEQDYSSGTADWTSGNEGRYTVEVTDGALAVAAVSNGNNGATVSTNANFTGKAEAGDDFTLEFDMALKGGNDQSATWFQVSSAAGNKDTSDYILRLSQITKNVNEFMINGYSAQKVTLSAEELYKFKVIRKGSNTFLEIKDAAGTDVFEKQPIFPRSADGGLSGMMLNTGRYYVSMKMDNVKVSDGAADAPEGNWYNVNINTTRYAKLDRNDNNTVFYADENGKIVIPIVPDNTTFNYTLSKTGYQEESGEINVNGAEVTVDKPLTIEESSGAEQNIYFESDWGNDAGTYSTSGRLSTMQLGTITTPALSTFSMDVEINKDEETQITWQLLNTANKDVIGLQASANGLWVFTDFNGSSSNDSDVNQSQAVGKYGNGVKLCDSYTGKYTVSFVFDRNSASEGNTGNATVKVSGTVNGEAVDVTQTIPLTQDTTNLSYMRTGKHRETATVTIDNVTVSEPNPNYINVTGDGEFAVIKDKTVTREYKASPAVVVPNETFTWTAKSAEGVDIDGVTIDQNGVLSVEDSVAAGTKVVVTATSATTATKTGSIEVTIQGVQPYTPIVEYTKAVQTGEEGQLTVTKIVDQLGDDVTEYFDPTWSIDGATVDADKESDVTFTDLPVGAATAIYATYNGKKLADVETEGVTIPDGGTLTLTAAAGTKVMLWNKLDGDDGIKPLAPAQTVENVDIGDNRAIVGSKSGKLLTNADADSGKVTVKLNITGSDQTPAEFEIVVGDFVSYGTYSDGAKIDVDSVVAEDTAITGYQVTIAKDGKLLNQSVVDKANVTENKVTVPTVQGADGAEVEVAPVYAITENIPATDSRVTFSVPADFYNITVTMTGRRADIYANEQLLVNNMLQYGETPNTEEVHDIYIKEGYANINTRDYDGSAATSVVSAIKLVKAPDIVDRKTKMYVLGDSLVCKYYNGGAGDTDEHKLLQTGWGQVLQNYIKDDIEVVDIANSGVTAVGLLGSAYSQVVESAQAGDYVVLESGYNDNQHSTMEIMKASVTTMVEGCKEKNLNIVLVSPNASQHDFKESVQFTSGMQEVATDTNTNFINLSKLSYDFLVGLYGSGESTKFTQEFALKTWNVSDRLHSTYNAANKWASIMATELGKLYPEADFVNTTYTYTFQDTDTTPNTITCQATAPAASAE